MRITLMGGEVVERPFSPSTVVGYVAESIELTSDDVRRMRRMAEMHPAHLVTCLRQLEWRFRDRRAEAALTGGFYEDDGR